MTRKEVYQQVKNLNLQEEIRAFFGVNYTNVGTKELISFVNNALQASECDCAFCRLLEVLAKKNILLKSELAYISEAL